MTAQGTKRLKKIPKLNGRVVIHFGDIKTERKELTGAGQNGRMNGRIVFQIKKRLREVGYYLFIYCVHGRARERNDAGCLTQRHKMFFCGLFNSYKKIRST